MVCEIVGSGITNISDIELALDVGLVMAPPFGLMNKIGVNKALELVEAYAKENPGFKVADILVKQAATGQPWKIPVVLREDKGNVALVKIRRPKVLNALNEEVFNQLREIFLISRRIQKSKGLF